MSIGRLTPPATGPAEEPRLRLAVLGPLRAWSGQQRLDLGPVRQQALLAALVLRSDTTVSQQALLDGVWGLEPPGTGGKVVAVYVHRLRKRLQEAGVDPADSVISWQRGGYRFLSDRVWLDVDRVEELAAEAGAAEQAGDVPAAVDAYGRALGLFAGEPLAGLPGPFAAGQRLRLGERRIVLAREKLERQLRLGEFDEAVAELTALVPAHPHSEPLAGLLMRALYGSGRQADALEVYARLRRRLVDEVGVEPGEEVRRVHQALLRGDDILLGAASQGRPATAPEPAAVRPQRRVRNELPADAVDLVGRDEELALLTAPADAERDAVAVDVVDGVAGVGKTALAVRVAHQVREQYPDGCLFVDLHGHSASRAPMDPQRALRRLLRAVDIDDNGIPDDLDELAASWRAATAAQRLLVVLDDVSGAEQVRQLVPAGPGSRVLLTSRARLAGLDVQRRVSLGPLGLDAAAGLLGQIVGQSRAGREREAARGLADLCGRLPLALRIAGARLQNRPMWTFEYLAGRLSDDERRLSELTVADRSVEAALHLSYDQLPAGEQRAFKALGRCPSVEMDSLVVATMLDCPRPEAERILENLVDASLVQQPVTGRYRLHDLVGVFSRQLPAPAAAVAATRLRVLRLYAAAAQATSDCSPIEHSGLELGDTPFTGWADAAAWLDTACSELVDVVSHAVAIGEPDYACWIASGLVDYFTRQGRYHECRAALELALPLADQASTASMASSLRVGMGFAHGMQGNIGQSKAWFTDALQLSLQSGDRRDQARARCGLGTLAGLSGIHAEAAAELAVVVDLAMDLDDGPLAALATCNLGATYHWLGQYEDALGSFGESLVLAEKAGSPRAIAKTLCFSGALHLDLGQYAEAAAALRRAGEMAEHAGDLPMATYSRTRLGTAEQGLGHLDTALQLHHRALADLTEQSGAELEVEIRNRLGGSYLAVGNPALARDQFELALAMAEANGNAAESARAAAGLNDCGAP